MNKAILTLSLILAFGINSYAQDKQKSENELTYTADESKIDSNEETITLVGNAKLKTSVIEIVNAEKIVINKKTEEIYVTGKYKINYLNGGIIISKKKKNWLRYKIGENKVYIE